MNTVLFLENIPEAGNPGEGFKLGLKGMPEIKNQV